MSTVIGQVSQYPIRKGKKEGVILTARFVNTTADAVIDQSASYTDDPGLTLVSAGGGLYTFAFPQCPSDAIVKVQLHHTGTPNVFTARLSALNLVAGTGTITTANAAGAATANNSAGMQLHVELTGAIRAGN